MAFTLSLDYSASIGGGRIQCWTVTGDGTDTAFCCDLSRAIACWAQNEDDGTITTGVSVTITTSGNSSRLVFGRPFTSGKKWKVFVLGE
jgi:hypothetical protein